MDWTLEDGLTAYVELLKDDAREQYRHDLLRWAVLEPHQKKPAAPPPVPTILR